MKRKITLLALVLVVVVLATSVLFACNDGVNGKYYKYENGVKDENSWIEIKGKKWSDSDGLSGKVKIDGESIVLMEDDIELLPGTIKDGVLYIGWEPTIITFVKDGATPPAKWELCTSHTLDSNCVCTKCNLTVHNFVGGVCEGCGKLVSREGDYVYFGTYPQSEVTDSTLKSTLTGSAGTLPTSTNSGSWTSYGYYIDGSVSNFMWYIDKEYEGEKYRGVYFTSYRPFDTTCSINIPNFKQDDNGYSTGTACAHPRRRRQKHSFFHTVCAL